MIWALAIAGGVIAAIVLGFGVNTWGRYSGATVPQVDPETLSHMLSPHYVSYVPEGEGPFPTALLFSGCDGPRDNMQRWAKALNAMGWAAIVVDSHNPRGFTEYQLWRLICAGQLLSGGERAGDVAVAIDDARQMDFVDPDRIALVGASHGGWAILEFLSMADHDDLPHTLTAWPESLREDPLEGIEGAVLLYPYCGQISRASRRGWTSDVPVMMLLAEGDAIADETKCLDIARDAQRRGLPVQTHVYSGVTHGFDQREKAPLSTLGFDLEATEDAIARVRKFLRDPGEAAQG